MRKPAVIVVLILFLGFGFNAYACLIPIYGGIQQGMQNCSEPVEQPAGQFCDSFKHLGIQASSASDSHYYLEIGSAVVLVSPPFALNTTPAVSRWQHHPIESHPRELCSSTIVLRI